MIDIITKDYTGLLKLYEVAKILDENQAVQNILSSHTKSFNITINEISEELYLDFELLDDEFSNKQQLIDLIYTEGYFYNNILQKFPLKIKLFIKQSLNYEFLENIWEYEGDGSTLTVRVVFNYRKKLT